MADDLADIRARYAADLLAKVGIVDQALERAFASVPRDRFLFEPPWLIVRLGAASGGGEVRRVADPRELYVDELVSLLFAEGINNGQPSLHVRALHALGVEPGDRIVHVGSGGGYYTAILATLAGDTGRVEARDVEPRLIDLATRALADRPTVHVVDARVTPLAGPYDAIYVSAAAPHVPDAYLDALADGGRVVMPLGPACRFGGMLRVERRGGTFGARFVSPAAFIGLRGGAEAGDSDALERAFARGDAREVVALHRGAAPKDDASVWYAWETGWLSTAD